VRAVETFLYAMADEDFDTVEGLMADGIEWQNVGTRRSVAANASSSSFVAEGPRRLRGEDHRIAARRQRRDRANRRLIFGRCGIQFWCAGCSRCTPAESPMAGLLDVLDFTKADGARDRGDVVPSLRAKL